jgi:hypothetical protein
VPLGVRFPVQLRTPLGFDAEDLATWPKVEGRLEYVKGRLLYPPPCADEQGTVTLSASTALGNWLKSHREYRGATLEIGISIGGERAAPTPLSGIGTKAPSTRSCSASHPCWSSRSRDRTRAKKSCAQGRVVPRTPRQDGVARPQRRGRSSCSAPGAKPGIAKATRCPSRSSFPSCRRPSPSSSSSSIEPAAPPLSGAAVRAEDSCGTRSARAARRAGSGCPVRGSGSRRRSRGCRRRAAASRRERLT